MEMQFRFFYGGDWNPYDSGLADAISRLTEERILQDPNREAPMWEILPKLRSFPDYVIALSKSTFWKYERDLATDAVGNMVQIEDMWNSAVANGEVGDFIKKVEAPEVEKAMCYWMACDYYRSAGDAGPVDFRLYFTEGQELGGADSISLEPYEG
jgi:hypothetical protein